MNGIGYTGISVALGLLMVADGAQSADTLTFVRPAVYPVSPTAPAPAVPASFDVIGHIQAATLDVNHEICAPTDDRLAGGWVTVNGIEILIPCNTVLQMPATSLTWAELFDPAVVPDGTPAGTSGLALADRVPLGVDASGNALALPAYEIHVQGNIVTDPNTGVSRYIAGLAFISQQSLNIGQGYIKSIDYLTGELCVSASLPPTGFPGQSVASPPCRVPDARVRINDPVGRFGLRHAQNGPAIEDGPVGRPQSVVLEPRLDRRFTADTDNPTIHAATGYPMCVPRFFPFGRDGDVDFLCPQQNRPKQAGTVKCSNLPPANGIVYPAFPAQADGYCQNFVMDALPSNPPPAPGPCGTAIDPLTRIRTKIPCTTRADRQAPFEIGDYIDYSGTLTTDGGNPSDPKVSNYYISAHTITGHLGIYTYPGTKPVYVTIEALLAGTNAQPLLNIPQEVTSRILVEAFTTDPSGLIDIFAMDVDKTTGAVTDRLLANVNPSGPPVIGRVHFAPAVGSYAPATRSLRVVSRSLCSTNNQPCVLPQTYFDTDSPVGKYANGLVAGQYNAPNFEFVFPENLFLGGSPLPNNFQDLAFLACGSGPLTTPTAGSNPPVVGSLTPAPWAPPMPAPSQCASAYANQLAVPSTQTQDSVTVLNALWDNQNNGGRLTLNALSSLPAGAANLQLYVQVWDAFGVPMAAEPQPMRLITNPAGVAPPPCGANAQCWQYAATGTVLDPPHAAGDPTLANNVFASPATITVYSSRGGVATLAAPALQCGVVGGVNTCRY